MDKPTNPLAISDEFCKALGLFHALHASIDLTLDYAIWKFLGVTPQQAHVITSGMMFGAKSRLLSNLVGASSHHRKQHILTALSKITSVKRDVIAHGHIWSSNNSVKFVERTRGGEFKVKPLEFTIQEFVIYVARYNLSGIELTEALSATYESINEFANAAFSLDRKSPKSTGKPASNNRP